MIYRFTRMSSLVLAFGIFFSFSCSNLKNTESDGSSNSDITSLQEQIREINREISENPENSELPVEKGNLLYRYSQTISNPANRQPVYSNIRGIADNYSAQFVAESGQLNDILLKAWRDEQTNGIKKLQENASERSEEEVTGIVAHFENAITLMPDSLKTYNVLATTHYQRGNLSDAIEILETADNRNQVEKPEVKEKLAYLYLESGDLVEAENRYRQLVEGHPDQLLYHHGLINVLILSDRHEEAIERLEELSEEYPTRYNYQESLATELYYLFKNRTDQYLQSSEGQLSESDREELAELLDSAHSLFESIQESLPTTEEGMFRIATFYKNTSTRLKELSTNYNNDELFTDLQSEYMQYSLPLWERLAELNPENMGYISNLYQVYVELGMNEDAESLERSYNF
ncbi:tetratricopeptide repeat protein [Rhodohalobacter sp. 614A]|uniref:tetratricopeptide repeat protein n=1 Tax=Rhodohalobacter sp. 614A TaxID=2908649 RepID=UPI001F41CA26|nr:tetratricopeptide repeat protein [Rhodohalobacter sp. 614A]